MNKVEKYLRSICDSVIESQSTNSKYFTIGLISIRLSDHIKEKMNYSLNIVESYNTNEFIVFTLSGRICIFNAKHTIKFIEDSLNYMNISVLPGTVAEKAINDIRNSENSIVNIHFNSCEELKTWAVSKFGTNYGCGKKTFKYLKNKIIPESKVIEYISAIRIGKAPSNACQLLK